MYYIMGNDKKNKNKNKSGEHRQHFLAGDFLHYGSRKDAVGR